MVVNMIKRDYNKEKKDNQRKYAYLFDFKVMHPFMLKSFAPYYVDGNVLELGSFEGEFTERLTKVFTDITCVEASSEAVGVAQKCKELNKVKFIESLFENVSLPNKYDNIFLVHVLEHLDDRVSLLKKINKEWLSDQGVLFVACPNAHAPSRQIAMHMGLMKDVEDVTTAEREHGHRVTYCMDTLRADIKKANLKIIKEGGIFFKAFANFQWDALLQTDIINQAYLDGCYSLGEKYPDLCSSIYFICKK